jgi:hypothetical protein
MLFLPYIVRENIEPELKEPAENKPYQHKRKILNICYQPADKVEKNKLKKYIYHFYSKMKFICFFYRKVPE